MEKILKKQLQEWLSTPAEKRNVATGAMLVRRITRNINLAINYERLPNRFAKMVEYQLSKFADVRIKENAEHKEVEKMAEEAERIAKNRKLDAKLPGLPNWKEQTRISKTEDFVKGKRADHDNLPEEIQACYAENLHLMQQMRYCRAQLLVVSKESGPTVCPDGERYPLVKELIELDKRYHANWQKYDEYRGR